jgi:hypothetical protein
MSGPSHGVFFSCRAAACFTFDVLRGSFLLSFALFGGFGGRFLCLLRGKLRRSFHTIFFDDPYDIRRISCLETPGW